MRFGELYDRAVEIGIANDPRGRPRIEQGLDTLRRKVESLSDTERSRFDTERLTNPYGDVRIVIGGRDTEFDTILTGIHIQPHDILLAGQLRQVHERIAIVAHHTTMFAGRALASLEDTLMPIVYRLEMVDVPRAEAETLVQAFIDEIAARIQPQLASARTLQVAEALGIPIIAIHTPVDLCYQAEEIGIIQASSTVGEAVESMRGIPEFVFSAGNGYPVELLAGRPNASIGKVFYAQSVGWRPSLAIMEAALRAGTGTIITTQAPSEYAALARSHGANLISVPHDMGDVRGMRLFYDRVFQGHDIRIIPCSNYRHLRH